jgi:hypothetical protein
MAKTVIMFEVGNVVYDFSEVHPGVRAFLVTAAGEEIESTENSSAARDAVIEAYGVPFPCGPYPLLELAKSMGMTISLGGDGCFVVRTGIKASTNTNCAAGLRCPECGEEGRFYVESTASMVVEDDGVEPAPGGDIHWQPDADCRCGECGYASLVEYFECPIAEDFVTPEADGDAQ